MNGLNSLSGANPTLNITMKSNICPLATGVLSLTLVVSSQAASLYTSLYAFGDSLTDSGNVFLATGGTQPANPLNFPGRFGNGPTWAEKLATDHLGLPAITTSLTGGTNYAWGGAWTGSRPDGYRSGQSVSRDWENFCLDGPCDDLGRRQ